MFSIATHGHRPDVPIHFRIEFFPCGPTVEDDRQSSRDVCVATIESPERRAQSPLTWNCSFAESSHIIVLGMEPSTFDEISFFRALERSRARALLIGRRALVLLGLPVLTADYDFWLSIDDIQLFNAVGQAFDLFPNRTADEARRHGRYVLENDEHIDVVVARSLSTIEGRTLHHDDLWARRRTMAVDDTHVCLPSLDDLILTKQVATRPKDLEDIRLLRILKEGHGKPGPPPADD